MMRHTIATVVNHADELIKAWKENRTYSSAAAVCEQTDLILSIVLDLVEENERLQAFISAAQVTTESQQNNDNKNTGQYL